jgi:hypothetical protein
VKLKRIEPTTGTKERRDWILELLVKQKTILGFLEELKTGEYCRRILIKIRPQSYELYHFYPLFFGGKQRNV